MFDIGWAEMAVVALIALVVIGPKELPNAMRSVAKWTRKARSLAREFQSGIDDMIREADLEDAKKAMDTARHLDVDKALEDTVDPTGSLNEEAKDLERIARQDASSETEAQPEAETKAAPQTGAPGEAETGDAKADDAGEEEERATVVQHPVSIAPPHSLTPPSETADGSGSGDEPAAAGDDGSQKRA